MFKYTKITQFMTPPSLGQGCGSETIVCFSRSAKKATALEGALTRRYAGDVDGCEIMCDMILEKDGKVIMSKWD